MPKVCSVIGTYAATISDIRRASATRSGPSGVAMNFS